MERQNNYDNNALTEVSLALAMAFFSIMVLSIYALSQSHISKNEKKLEIVDKNKIPPKIKKIDDILIYYHSRNYYDKNFNKIELNKFKTLENIILSVSPKISLENLFKIKSNFQNNNVKITQFHEETFKNFLVKE